jgi:hypothetical protein
MVPDMAPEQKDVASGDMSVVDKLDFRISNPAQ